MQCDFYERPLKAFLFNDLSAVEEHDGELIYFLKNDEFYVIE